MITSLKQRKIKFKPRIKLNHVTIICVSVVKKKNIPIPYKSKHSES